MHYKIKHQHLLKKAVIDNSQPAHSSSIIRVEEPPHSNNHLQVHSDNYNHNSDHEIVQEYHPAEASEN